MKLQTHGEPVSFFEIIREENGKCFCRGIRSYDHFAIEILAAHSNKDVKDLSSESQKSEQIFIMNKTDQSSNKGTIQRSFNLFGFLRHRLLDDIQHHASRLASCDRRLTN